MKLLKNPWRKTGFPDVFPPETPFPSIDAARVANLLSQCPAHARTPLVNAAELAKVLRLAELHVKDERPRTGLGSFKALTGLPVLSSNQVLCWHMMRLSGLNDQQTGLGRLFREA